MEEPAAERWFWRALLFCALFHVAHAVALPIVVTYDGSEYVRLADLLTSPNFMAEYSFRRPPFYPLLLKASFYCFGRQPLAAQLPNMVMGFCGIALLAFSLRRMGRPWLGISCMILMTFDPLFISYEHTILTEAGCFFCIALILYVLVWSGLQPGMRSLLLVLTLALGYYQRPTLIYLAPIVGLIHAVDFLLKQPQRSRSEWLRAARHFAAVLVLPFVLAYPWNRLLAKSNESNFGQQILLYGILKQAVLPPDDPIFGPSRENYQKALDTCAPGGKMDWAGLTGSALLPVEHEMLNRCVHDGYAIFWHAVSSYPLRYLQGLGRTIFYFAGLPNNDSENQTYVNSVITEAAAGSKLQAPTHPLFTQTQRDFTQKGGASLLSRGLNRLNGLYRILLPIASLITVLGFVAGLWRRNTVLAAFCGVPLAAVAMYVLPLIALDRYVLPAYPIVLANIFIVPALLMRRREPERKVSEVAAQSFATTG